MCVLQRQLVAVVYVPILSHASLSVHLYTSLHGFLKGLTSVRKMGDTPMLTPMIQCF